MKPAWSWQFDDDVLRPAPSLQLPSPMTRSWAWEDSTGAGVKVAIIDSGIEADHPAVQGTSGGVALEFDPDAEEAGWVRTVEGPHEDLYGHGTACAGIVRAIAPDADLYSVRVLGERLTGKGVVFAAGIRWAIEHEMQVVNMSLSSSSRDYFDLFHELADEAYFHNVMLVCAVNNVPKPSFPSVYSSVFSVAATESNDPMGFMYNPAPPVEFGAPGIDVDVAWLEGSSVIATGNSFAAPHIAGVIAKILGKHPGLTPFQVKTILASLAANSGDRA